VTPRTLRNKLCRYRSEGVALPVALGA